MDEPFKTLSLIDDAIWIFPLIMIVAVGVYFTFKLKFIQITKIKEALHATFNRNKENPTAYSSFHIFCVSMGNRIGVGNITGPIIAIMIGGAGSIFWMWIFAFIGAATSFVETTVGQIYKSRKEDGGFIGGPAYSIAKALKNRKLAIAMAIIMVFLYLGGFLSMEACTISESLCSTYEFEYNNFVFAAIITLITGLIIIGGFNRISKISVWLVPLMAIMWVIVCIISICFNGNVAGAFGIIFQQIVAPPERVLNGFVGGAIGTMLMVSMKKGVLSNEAGIGTIPNISSMAVTNHPAKQGLSQMFGVIMDILICTLTAIVILSYNDFDGLVNTYVQNENAMEIFQTVFKSTYGEIAAVMVSIFVAVFAITSLMGDYVIGKNNIEFITKDSKPLIIVNILVLALVFFSSCNADDRTFTIVNIMLAVAGVVNCAILFKMCGKAFEAYNDYNKQKKEGTAEPNFHKDCISDTTGITEWP